MARSKLYTVRFMARLDSGELVEACEIRLFAKSHKRATKSAWNILPDMRDYSGLPVNVVLHSVGIAP